MNNRLLVFFFSFVPLMALGFSIAAIASGNNDFALACCVALCCYLMGAIGSIVLFSNWEESPMNALTFVDTHERINAKLNQTGLFLVPERQGRFPGFAIRRVNNGFNLGCVWLDSGDRWHVWLTDANIDSDKQQEIGQAIAAAFDKAKLDVVWEEKYAS